MPEPRVKYTGNWWEMCRKQQQPHGETLHYLSHKLQAFNVAARGDVYGAADDVGAQAAGVEGMETGEYVEGGGQHGQIALFTCLISRYIGGLEPKISYVLAASSYCELQRE